MDTESSALRIRNIEGPSKCTGVNDSSNLELKSKDATKRKTSNDTIICGVIILFSLTFIIYRTNIISTRILSGLTVKQIVI